MITLSKEELITLIETSFSNGALSYNKWSGQPDTCWMNVADDAKDESESVIKNYETNNEEEV